MGALRLALSEECSCPLISLRDSWEVQLRMSASDPQISLQRNGLHPEKDGIKKTIEKSLRMKGKERSFYVCSLLGTNSAEWHPCT